MNIRYNAHPLFPSVVHYIEINDFEDFDNLSIDQQLPLITEII